MRRQMLLAAALGFFAVDAAFAETLKVALPQKGNWDTGIVEYGVKAGIFKDAGLDIDISYTPAAPRPCRRSFPAASNRHADRPARPDRRLRQRRAGARHLAGDHRLARAISGMRAPKAASSP